MINTTEKDVNGQLQKLSLEEEAKGGASTTVVMRLILQSTDVGKIIGPKGTTVEGFKQKTGANISFSPYQPSMPRVAKIAGPIKGVVQAIMMISKTVASDSPALEADSKEGEEKSLSAVLMVPFPHVGRIIGKRGQRIKMLREESGTNITIVQNNVTISGRHEQVESAVHKLTELLQEVSKRNPVSYAFPFENSAASTHSLIASQAGKSNGHLLPAALQYHMVQLAPDTMQVLIPSSSAGVVIGRGGSTIQRLKSESGASISLSNYVKGAENRVATISGTPPAMSQAILALAVQIATDGGNLPENAMTLSIVLLVPPQELGAIIGKKGARITDLRNTTTASINVSDEGSVTIQGSTQAVSEAIKKIANLLYETRNNKLPASPQLASATVPNVEPPTPATNAQPDAPEKTTDSKQSKRPPSDTANGSGKASKPEPPPTLFNANMPPSVDSKIFLPSLLQTTLSSKFPPASNAAKATPAKGTGQGAPASDVSAAAKPLRKISGNGRSKGSDQITSGATYAQKTAGIKPPSPPSDKGLAPIGLSGGVARGVYPPSGFTQGSQLGQPVYHTFSSEMLHAAHHAQHALPSTQQGHQPHQVVLIGNHWTHPALSPQQQQQHHPPRRDQGNEQQRPMERKQQGAGDQSDQNGKNAMPTQILSGLPSVLQSAPSNQGSHQVQTHQFTSAPITSAFPQLQGTALGQNFYASATSWYTPQPHRFQAYAEPPQQMNPQSWQPAGAHRQQQSANTVVVPSTSIPINQTTQSMSAEGMRSTDPWS